MSLITLATECKRVFLILKKYLLNDMSYFIDKDQTVVKSLRLFLTAIAPTLFFCEYVHGVLYPHIIEVHV